MNIDAASQAYSFFIFLINGFCIGLIFDIFRISRRSFKTSDVVTYIEDILFWILSGILTLYSIIMFNEGEIRAYIFIAIIIGAIIYLITVSKYIIKFSVIIINFIKSIMGTLIKFILYPIKMIFKFLKKVFFKPISFFIINIQQMLSKPVKKIKKATKM